MKLTFFCLLFGALFLAGSSFADEIKLKRVSLPISNCPQEVIDVTLDQLNKLREAQKANATQFKSIKPLKISKEMSDSATAWIANLAASLQQGKKDIPDDDKSDSESSQQNLKPNYPEAGQYVAGKSVKSQRGGRDLAATIDLSDLDILAGWSGKVLIDRKPTYTGDSKVRPFYDEEWRRTVEFGVGCAGWQQEVEVGGGGGGGGGHNDDIDDDNDDQKYGGGGGGGRRRTVTKNFFRLAIHFKHPPKKEIAFAKVPSYGCPPIVNSVALTGFNERRAKESLASLTPTTEMTNAAAEWLADATEHPDLKPDYPAAGQFIVNFAGPRDNNEIDLSGLNVFQEWSDKNGGRPLFTGTPSGRSRPFTAKEWANTLNFGYACVAADKPKEYLFKLAVFFKYPEV